MSDNTISMQHKYPQLCYGLRSIAWRLLSYGVMWKVSCASKFRGFPAVSNVTVMRTLLHGGKLCADVGISLDVASMTC